MNKSLVTNICADDFALRKRISYETVMADPDINKYTIRKYLAIPEDEIPENKPTSRERQHRLAMQQKQQEVDDARKLAQDGYPIERISIMMHHTSKTIQNYLNLGYSVTNGHYNARIHG